jgi:uncharacterized repeat protein (TIGR02543 family)
VDSTVYSDNGGGGSFNFNIFRKLQQAFPDCIFFPENENDDYYGASAPYNQVNVGVYDSSWTAKLIYPQAFSILAQVDSAPAANYPVLVQSLKNGNIFFYENIWWEQDTDVEQLYQEAAIPSNNLMGYGLTVAGSGKGSGNVTGNIGAINCPSANCTAAFDGGTSVTLTALPASGSTFTGWTGACSGSATTCVVAMNSNQTVTANFVISSTTYPITVSNAGNGFGEVFGAVALSSNIINCGVNPSPPANVCSTTVTNFTSVTLTAAAASGSTLSGWTVTGGIAGPDCAGTAGTCTVSVNAATNVTATFTSTGGPSVNGVCGTAAQTYLYTAIGYGSNTLCKAGNPDPTTVVFPMPGSKVNWTCVGTNNGLNSSCSAKRNDRNIVKL